MGVELWGGACARWGCQSKSGVLMDAVWGCRVGVQRVLGCRVGVLQPPHHPEPVGSSSLSRGMPGTGVPSPGATPTHSCFAATPTHNHRRACLKMKVFVCCASSE